MKAIGALKYGPISIRDLDHLVRQLGDGKKASPRGQWINKENGSFVAIDNEDGYIWTEEFKTRKKAIIWLETGEM